MKKFLLVMVFVTGIVIALTGCMIEANAQQCDPPIITQTYGNNPNGNALLYGDLIVVGSGMVGSGNNFIGFTNLRYNGNFSIFLPFNSNQHLWLNGTINYHAGISLTGGGTVHIEPGSIVHIHNIVGNNSNNKIILSSNDSVLVNQTYYKVGMTLIGPNPSNNISFVACTPSTPLNIKIVSFKLQEDILRWVINESTKDNIEIQYSENPLIIPFKTVYVTSSIIGTMQVKESGFYRLKVGELYSEQIRYNMTVLVPNEKSIRLYRVGNLYGTKKLK